MARTNKMGIAKKKAQQAKQKKIIGSASSQEGTKKDYTNPKGNSFTRFFRSGKFVCDKTGVREDADGYRIVRKASGGEVDFEFKGVDAWGYRKYIKKARKISLK